MPRSRLGVVLILLVLILIVASILFGVLTYGLDGEGQPPSTPDQESMKPGRSMDRQYTAASSAEPNRRLSSQIVPRRRSRTGLERWIAVY